MPLIQELVMGPDGGRVMDVSFLKTARILRALRPLRLISRNENLKLVVNTLFKSIPELSNLLIVTLLFFLIFALFGTSYFKGQLFSCKDTELEDFSFEDTSTVKTLEMCITGVPGGGDPARPPFLKLYQP